MANIDLLDIALRRPSLDEVFFALTNRDDRDPVGGAGRPRGIPNTRSGRPSLQHNGVESASDVDAESFS